MPSVIAHRGLNRHFPENTLPAFRAAVEVADGLELDVQLAKCGTLVVAHDEDLHRLYGVRRRIGELTAIELKELRPVVPAEEPEFCYPPTLREVLDIVPPDDFELNIEIKAPRVQLRTPTRALAEILEDISHEPLVSSFNPIELARLASYRRSSRLALLFAPEEGFVLREALAAPILSYAKFEALHPSWKLVSPDLIERAHDAGWKVNVWTVNDPKRALWLRDEGVDGLISDVADELQEALAD